jgi:hypothetical protein
MVVMVPVPLVHGIGDVEIAGSVEHDSLRVVELGVGGAAVVAAKARFARGQHRNVASGHGGNDVGRRLRGGHQRDCAAEYDSPEYRDQKTNLPVLLRARRAGVALQPVQVWGHSEAVTTG